MTRTDLDARLIAFAIVLQAYADARDAAMTSSDLAAEACSYLCRLREERSKRRPARPITYATRARIMERDDFRCRRCGAGPRDERLVVDHVMPVALGGSHDDENLQTLCEPCNQGKGARPPHPHDLEACQ